MSVPLAHSDQTSSTDQPEMNGAKSIVGDPEILDGGYNGANVSVHAEFDSLPDAGQRLLSNLAKDGPHERILTLEDCLALRDIIDSSEIELRAVPDDPSIAQYLHQLKLAILERISALLRERVELSRRQEDLDMAIDFETIGVQLTRGNDSEN
ncbi:hypothetical protein FS749_009328, partial [Ceratobasidium sp. UAMH 11750]